MSSPRRRFQRKPAERRYRKLFILSVEGDVTEREYFNMFNNQQSVIRVKCLDTKHESSPPQVLKRMKKRIKEEGLIPSDEAWLVVDKDHWTDEQLAQLHAWAQQHDNYGFALSNPRFEYWLLLHFEDGDCIESSHDCHDRLKRHLPNYEKKIECRKFPRENINNAILRAKQRDNPRCDDWPRKLGGTTVYRLVEKILQC